MSLLNEPHFWGFLALTLAMAVVGTALTEWLDGFRCRKEDK